MTDYRLTEAEENLAAIIWANEPIKSPDLVKLCNVEFNWKKSTTYTMLRRLQDKKVFQNNNSIIISLVKKDDFYGEQSKIFVKEKFAGSLPKFITAFTRKNKLSLEEVEALKQLINEHKEG